MRTTLVALLILLAAPAMAAPSLSNMCSGVGTTNLCRGTGWGWWLDRSTGDMHLLRGQVDWLELSASGTTLTLSSLQGTSLVFSDALSLSSTLTVTGDVTLNGGSGALTVAGPIDPGPWFEVSFTEGASKGVTLMQYDGTAYDTTADVLNELAYGEHFRGLFITATTATGTITPAGTALGLDLNAGSPGNSDEWALSTGQLGASGGLIIPGTTAAWEACVTADLTDVSEVAGFWLLVTTPGVPVVLSSADPNYTSYAGIGIEQTDIVVSDNTDGAVDTTTDAVDLTPVELCIRGSAAGAVTYYIDGAQTAAAATHTLGDGVPHIVRIQGLNHTGTEAPMNVSAFSLLPQ